MTPKRMIETFLTVVSAIFVANFVCTWMGGQSFVPGEFYAIGSMLGLAWFLILIFQPKTLSK